MSHAQEFILSNLVHCPAASMGSETNVEREEEQIPFAREERTEG